MFRFRRPRRFEGKATPINFARVNARKAWCKSDSPHA